MNNSKKLSQHYNNISNKHKVYIVGSSSLSALGIQHKSEPLNVAHIKLTDISIENTYAPYYQMKGVNLKKNIDDMVALLSEHIEQVIVQASLTPQQHKKTVLFLGSTSLDIDAVMPDLSKDIWLSQTDKLGKILVNKFGLHAIHFTFNTACTSSANAMLYASQLIQRGKIQHAIVVGFEFFNQLSINGFDSLDLISKTSVKPFSKNRDGLILGEGIGAIVLSNKANSFTEFEFLGGYSSCDDYSLTITDEAGTHIVEVVKQALSNANITLSDIGVVKVHGTASEKSDLAEFNALKLLFKKTPRLLAFKSFIGHTLGACGVLEVALLNHIVRTKELPIYNQQAREKNQHLLPFIESINELQSTCVLLNHFGFGGNNAALILRQISPNKEGNTEMVK